MPRVGYRLLTERSEPVAAAPDLKPSIAVMPFANMSSDPEQDFFAAGLSEDLITDLSKVPGLAVIARSSSFALKDSAADAQTIGQDLQVRYIVQGSVRRAADRVRINVQLIDVGEHIAIWADRFDGELENIFALQDQVVGRIVRALSDVLPSAKAPGPRRTTNLDAYDLFSRGRSIVLVSPEAYREGQALLAHAAELDPDFGQVHAWMAMGYIHAWLNWGEPQELNRAHAMRSAERAVALDPSNADAHAMLGYVTIFDRRPEDGAALLARALELNPNHADALVLNGEAMVHLGRIGDGVASLVAAYRLNPHPPGWYHWINGFTLIAAGRYEEPRRGRSEVSRDEPPGNRSLAAPHLRAAVDGRARFLGGAGRPGRYCMNWSVLCAQENFAASRNHFSGKLSQRTLLSRLCGQWRQVVQPMTVAFFRINAGPEPLGPTT